MPTLETGAPPQEQQFAPAFIPEARTGDELLALRNQAVDAVLNPDGTIPRVALVDRYERSPRQSTVRGIDNHQYSIMAEDGVEIGYARVDVPYGKNAEKEGAGAQVDTIEIRNQDYKGRGMGKATYIELLKQVPAGMELACDPRGVSPDAIKIWQWMESRGLASRPAELGPAVPSASGKYERLGYRTNLVELTEFAALR